MNNSHLIGEQLCEAWGIDPRLVHRIEIVIDARQPSPFAVVHSSLDEQAARILLDLKPKVHHDG